MTSVFVSVVIDVKIRALDRPFVYRISDTQAQVERISVGSAVAVRFNSRPVVGYVIEIVSEETALRDAHGREILEVLACTPGPFFDSHAVFAARYIAEEYGGSLTEAIRMFCPPSGRFAIKPICEEQNECSDIEGKTGKISPARYELTHTSARAKYVTHYALSPAFNKEQSKLTVNQVAVIDALEAASGTLSKAALIAASGQSSSVIERLAKRGDLIATQVREIRSIELPEDALTQLDNFTLTAEQRNALAAIFEMQADGGGVLVIDGVTGSGKTEIYLRAIKSVVEQGMSALVLVPEISLTPQTVARFNARFPGLIGVLHSRLTPSERQDQWDMIAAGESRVVVGARSALFAPMQNLGLIVIDEEHDSSYKQGNAPRYHARNVAKFMAEHRGISLVLGSATPSLETLHSVIEGDWRIVELKERATGSSLPDITVVDLVKEFEEGNRSVFSRELMSALEAAHEAEDKVLLFLNRRGTASFLLCRECGYVPECVDCSTSLTYHGNRHHLRCHQCDRLEAVPSTCPKCDSLYLRQFGAGTQRIEEELAYRFPTWPVIRMDADTTTGRASHAELLDKFRAEKSAILLGTQMIAKGHDFPEITLAGIITADTSLNLPDFRAEESTYQLLEQVSGRAGRGSKPGRVIIQTYRADHPAIEAVRLHSREFFTSQELPDRRELFYPPYSRLANIIISSRNEKDALTGATTIADALQLNKELIVLGPAPAILSRVKGKYRFHLVIKAPLGYKLGEVLHHEIKAAKLAKETTVALDVDPSSLM